jgi:hypothetical protein
MVVVNDSNGDVGPRFVKIFWIFYLIIRDHPFDTLRQTLEFKSAAVN